MLRQRWITTVTLVVFALTTLAPVALSSELPRGARGALSTGNRFVPESVASPLREVWACVYGKLSTATAPVIADGRIVFSGIEKGYPQQVVYCVDATTGNLVWRYAGGVDECANLSARSVLVSHGRVFAIDDNGQTIVALNLVDGSVVWKSGPIQSGMVTDSLYVLAAAGGVVGVMGCLGIHGFDAATGKHLWTTWLPRGAVLLNLVSNSTMFFLRESESLNTFTVQGIDTSGKVIWATNVPKRSYEETMAVTEDTLYYSWEYGCLRAVDTKTGTTRWEAPLKDTAGYRIVNPTIGNDLAFVHATVNDAQGKDHDGLVALRLSDGQVAWRIDDGVEQSSPIYTPGHLWALVNNRLTDIDPATGRIQWDSSNLKYVDGFSTAVPYAGSLYFWDKSLDRTLIRLEGAVKSTPAVEPGGTNSRPVPPEKALQAARQVGQLLQRVKDNPSLADDSTFQREFRAQYETAKELVSFSRQDSTWKYASIPAMVASGRPDDLSEALHTAGTAYELAGDVKSLVESAANGFSNLGSLVGGKLLGFVQARVADALSEAFLDHEGFGNSPIKPQLKKMMSFNFFEMMAGTAELGNWLADQLRSIGMADGRLLLVSTQPILAGRYLYIPWNLKAEMAPHLVQLNRSGVTVVWIPPIDEIQDWCQTLGQAMQAGATVEELSKVAASNSTLVKALQAIRDGNVRALAVPFPDLIGHWSAPEVAGLFEQEIVSGMPDGSFAPDAVLTRAQLIKMMVLASGHKPQPASPCPVQGLENHWLVTQGYLQAAVDAGIVVLADYPKFKPDEPISRAEIAALSVRASGLPLQSELSGPEVFSDWSAIEGRWQPYAAKAYALGIVRGYETEHGREFRPSSPATRAEAAAMVRRLQQAMTIPHVS